MENRRKEKAQKEKSAGNLYKDNIGIGTLTHSTDSIRFIEDKQAESSLHRTKQALRSFSFRSELAYEQCVKFHYCIFQPFVNDK